MGAATTAVLTRRSLLSTTRGDAEVLSLGSPVLEGHTVWVPAEQSVAPPYPSAVEHADLILRSADLPPAAQN